MSTRTSESPATSAKRRVDKGLEALRAGLAPWVEKHMRDRYGAQWRQYVSGGARDDEAVGPLDVQALLKTLLSNWNDVFRRNARLRKARSFVSLALEARNAVAHFAGEMEARAALRHLDAMRELLVAVGASDRASAVAALYDEQLKACDKPDTPPRRNGSPPKRRHRDVGGKYAPLYHHLSARRNEEWRASFGEIEAILGFRLPDSARRHRPWWANGGHGQARAWLAAGWRTHSVNLAGETLTFERMAQAQTGPDSGGLRQE